MMKAVLVTVLSVFAVSVFAAQSDSGGLPSQLPEIGEGWHIEASGLGEKATRVRFANAKAEWVLYSSPQSPLLYGISHYRVSPKKATGLFDPAIGGKRYHGREVVAWFEGDDGIRLRFFVKSGRKWREIDRASPAWERERGIVMRVWSVHALIGVHDEDPRLLVF